MIFRRAPDSETWHFFDDCPILPKGELRSLELEDGEMPKKGKPCGRCWRRHRRETGEHLPGYQDTFVQHAGLPR